MTCRTSGDRILLHVKCTMKKKKHIHPFVVVGWSIFHLSNSVHPIRKNIRALTSIITQVIRVSNCIGSDKDANFPYGAGTRVRKNPATRPYTKIYNPYVGKNPMMFYLVRVFIVKIPSSD